MVRGRARESESLGCIPSFAADSLGDLDQWLHPLHLHPENEDLMTVPRKKCLSCSSHMVLDIMRSQAGKDGKNSKFNFRAPGSMVESF